MINPETICIRSERDFDAEQLHAYEQNKQSLLHVMYLNKARACGMTLDGYCQRFGIVKSWETESAGTTSGSAELGSTG